MATVARTMAKAPVGVLPPASPFAELLRRSRFASYDPEIKQTYSAPPAYAQRGNWGLKRPISQRNRNAYITLKSYEDHAQYIEWNNAGAEVRFVKRFEELNMAPDMSGHIETTFAENLGSVKTSVWLTDSEFDTANDGEYRFTVAKNETVEVEKPFDAVQFDALGNKGKGQYGAKQPPTVKSSLSDMPDMLWNFRRPNIEAMSDAEFQKHLKKLRELRPQFLQEISRIHAERLRKDELQSTMLNGEVSDLQLASINSSSDDHNAFLDKHFEVQYEQRNTSPSSPDPVTGETLPEDFVKPYIKPQPHRFGGLLYAHPTILDTYFTTEARPAFVLNELAKSNSPPVAQVSFGGTTAKLDAKSPFHIKPLFTAVSGPKDGAVQDSIMHEVRPKAFQILSAPTVVSKNPRGLHSATLKATVTNDASPAAKGWENVHRPGTYAYNSALSAHAPNVSMSRPKARPRESKKTGLAMEKLKGLATNRYKK